MKKNKIWLIGTIIAIVILIAAGGFFLARKNTLSGGLKMEKNTVKWNQNLESVDESADIQIPY